jgi:hypothetical protein
MVWEDTVPEPHSVCSPFSSPVHEVNGVEVFAGVWVGVAVGVPVGVAVGEFVGVAVPQLKIFQKLHSSFPVTGCSPTQSQPQQ